VDEKERVRGIVAGMRAKADSGALGWEQLESSRTRFGTTVAGRAVTIRSEDKDDVAPFRLSFYGDGGIEILSVRSIMGAPIDKPDDQALNRDLGAIYKAAKADALGVDRLLDELEQDLGM
jgi:hypothetical protein